MSQPLRSAPPPPPIRKGQVQAFEALYSYEAQQKKELSFEEGDLLFIVDQTDPNWWLARLNRSEGYIPSNYVSKENVRLPIIDAAKRGNLELLDECLASGMSVNTLDKSGSSALHASAQGGHLGCVLRLLQEPKLEMNLQNKLGDTPLHCASYRGHAEVVSVLLESGAKADVVNMDNCTPRALAKRGSIITILDENRYKGKRKSSTYTEDAYGFEDSEDSD